MADGDADRAIELLVDQGLARADDSDGSGVDSVGAGLKKKRSPRKRLRRRWSTLGRLCTGRWRGAPAPGHRGR